MGLPVQVPLAAVSVWPWVAVPLMLGAAELVGAAGGGGADDPTVAVGCEDAAADPPSLVAVTATRAVWPTSPAARV